MRAAVGDVLVALVLVAVASMDTPDMWRTLARACQVTAGAVGRVGIYAERQADVLMIDTA
jgi:cytosine/adenosine deaminase-related metal-dependent hydrolase